MRFRPPLYRALLFLGGFLIVAGCVTSPAPVAPGYEEVVANPARLEKDREEDAQRMPLEFLRFSGVKPGMRALDVWSGAGYTSELIALAVGPSGHVWSQNDKPSKRLTERLLAHPQANLEPVVQGFDNPVPGAASGLDLVTIVMSYHDIAGLPVDRAVMDAHLFAALRPGGHLILIDHSARAGTPAGEGAKLHRIDEALAVREFEAAGFRLEGHSDFLRHPEDPRNQAFFDMKGPSDKFALRFVRP